MAAQRNELCAFIRVRAARLQAAINQLFQSHRKSQRCHGCEYEKEQCQSDPASIRFEEGKEPAKRLWRALGGRFFRHVVCSLFDSALRSIDAGYGAKRHTNSMQMLVWVSMVMAVFVVGFHLEEANAA